MPEPAAPKPANAGGNARARARRVEPVSEEFDPDEIFDPKREARPGLAAWLFAGPVLAAIGVLGWLRLLAGVRGPVASELDFLALGIDGFLVLVFVASHSFLARGAGRRVLNHPLGPAGERPLYVLVAGATLTLLVLGWRQSGPMIWNYEGVAHLAARIVQISGLLLAAWAVLRVGAGDLVGLPQLRSLESGTQPPTQQLVALPPYRWLRQPLNLGLLMVMAGMPEASADRVLLVGMLALWIFFAAPLEERDAEISFGRAYAKYRKRTPRWWPRFRRSSGE